MRGLLGSCRCARYARGERVAERGRRPDDLLVALDGRLKRDSGSAGAAEMIAPYEAVGLEALLDGGEYSQSIVADQDSTVLHIPWKALKPLVDRVPGLGGYLKAVSESAPVRDVDLSLEDMGCSPAFRCALIGGLTPKTVPQDTWIVRDGEVPGFVFFGVVGTVQAFGDDGQGELKPLWVAPNLTWQLFDACLAARPLTHHLKAGSRVDLYEVSAERLRELRSSHPDDFAAFVRLAKRVEAEKAEDDEVEREVETLEELFPAPPRAVRSFRFSYPFVRQSDEMDCGAACMAMISQYYGNDLSIHYWRSRLNVNREGTTLFDIAFAAEKVGFVCHGLKIDDPRNIEPGFLPMITLRRAHFVVIYQADRRGILIGDPEAGVIRMSWERFRDGWMGEVMMLKPTEAFYHEKAPQAGYAHFLTMFRGQGLELGLIAATSLMVTILSTVPAFLTQFILDEVLVKKDSSLLIVVLTATLVVYVMIDVIDWLRNYYLVFVTSRFDFASQSSFMRKLFSLPYDFFAKRHIGDFTRRLGDLSRMREFVTGQLIGTLLNFLNLVVYGVALFRYSPQVAIVVYLTAPTMVLISVLYSRKLQLMYSDVFSLGIDRDGLLSDLIRGVSTIKTLGAEVASRWRYEESHVSLLKSAYKFSMSANGVGVLASMTHSFINLGIMGLAAYMGIRGQMTPGQVVSISMLASGVIGPFAGLASLWAEVQEMRVVMDRLNDVYLAESETKPDKRSLIKQRLRGEIEFRDVWFRYGGESSEWVIKGMSFHVMPGQSVAVVGRSGSGKSTVALLTARLYEPTKGSILIDGRDYREYDRLWLRRQVGLLLQETHLFHGTILENIAYGDPRPEVARVDAAVATADAAGFIAEKSTGYDYVLTHGGFGLSAGEKQRISIARILYANPAILFMDEATASLDAESEKKISKALRQVGKDRTVISIAHRYNTVRMSDFAMVVDAGRVVEFGTHAELLRLRGHYAQLFGEQIGA